MDLLERMGRVLRSPAFKFLLILLLIVLLLIPLFLVYGLIWERESRAQGVRGEVGRLWGPEQRLLGPFLVVPYTVRIETVQGEKRIEQIQERRAVFTPETLEVAGRADAKTLRRSIFEVPVYAARLKLSGRFAAPRIADVAAEVVAVRWRDVAFVLGLSGVAGLKEAAVLKIAGAGTAEMPFAPSVGFPSTHLSGIHAKLAGAGSALFPDPEQPLQALPSRSISPSTGPSRSRSRRSRARRACRFPPIGRIRASPARSCRTSGRSRPRASRPPGESRTWPAACPRPGASPRRAWSGCNPTHSA